MIYRFLVGLVRISLYVYFKNMVVSGKENIPDHGPLILVANHPNTLMDPIIVGSITRQQIGFVANAGIFSNSFVSAIFRYFRVIPIFRKKDVAEGEKPDNKQSFAKCHEYLAEGGTFLIFPEGSSYYELKLREIKTGTARIALSFEALKNFEGSLQIVPVTLDYSDSIQFRSMVSVVVNPPIRVSAYREAYLENEFEGVKRLTEDIRARLARNIPQTSGKEQEIFLIKAHKFYTTFCEPDADLYNDLKHSLEIRKNISNFLQQLELDDLARYQHVQEKVHRFFREIKSERLTAGFFTNQFLRKSRTLVIFGYLLTFILMLPVYVPGLIANYLPYILPSRIFEMLKLEIEYKTPVQMVSGMILFPLFYGLEIILFRSYLFPGLWPTVMLLIGLPVSAYVVMYFWTEMQRFVRVVRFYMGLDQGRKSELLNLRNEIIGDMRQWSIRSENS